MGKRTTEAHIAFRSNRKSKLPKEVEIFDTKDFRVWTLGEDASCGGLSLPEAVVRKNEDIESLWKPFEKVHNKVKRRTSWEIWWGPNLSLMDFIIKENSVQWIQSKIRQPLGVGKTLVLRTAMYLKIPWIQVTQLEKLMKLHQSSTQN